jgi:hypothetical protein
MCVCVWIFVCVCVCVYVFVYVYMCMCICVHICEHLHIYIHTYIYILKCIPSKLLTSTGFSRKIFFFSKFLVGVSLVKKSTVRVKSGFMKCQNQNFDFALQNPPTKFLSEHVEVTRWASNFDRYIYLLKIMPSIEQEMERCTYILFVKQCGDMNTSVTAWKRWIKTFQDCQLFCLK